MRGRRAAQFSAIVMTGVVVVTGGWSCSSRQVSSGSGDQSATAKPKSDTEIVKPDQVVSVPSSSAATTVQPSSPVESTPGQDTRASLFTPSAPASVSEPERKTPADVTGLGDVFFDFDQYVIRRDAQAVLEGNAQWLRNQSGKTFLIEGHCDERGTQAYNLVLGEKRAKATKHYLENLGISASRLRTTSYGEIKPFCMEHNEGCWKHNRRAHFVVQ